MRETMKLMFQQETAIAWRTRGQALTPLFFLILIVTLFPLILETDPQQLTAMAPGLLWINLLLAQLLILPTVFNQDFLEGRLELIVLSEQPTTVVIAKVLLHWLIHVVPLLLLVPLFALLFHLQGSTLVLLCLSLLCGTVLLQLLGSLVAALTLGLQSGGVLLALLVVPLFIPVIILGVSTVSSFQLGLSVLAPLALLVAMLLLALSVLPWVITAALRIGLQSS